MSLALLLALTAHADESPVPTPEPYVLIQSFVTLYDQDQDPVADPATYGDPEDDPGLKLRRARLGFQGRGNGIKYGLVFGMASPYDAIEAANHDPVLVDAYGGYRPVKGMWVVAGVQKVPVGREMLMGAAQLPMAERSVATEWIDPGRDVGVVIDETLGEDDLKVRLRLGGFNGNGSALGDDNVGKLLSARAEVAYGADSVYRTYGVVDGLSFGVAGDFFSDTGLNVKSMGYGGDALVRVAGLAVLVEGRMRTLQPVDSPAELPGVLSKTNRLGLTGQVGYTVGSLEPVVRFSTFDDDMDVTDNGDVAEGMGGVTWHSAGDAIRAGGGYVLRLEQGGATVPNDTARLWLQLKL